MDNNAAITQALLAIARAEEALREARSAVNAISFPAPIKVDVPYRSQHDQDAQSFTGDCGPACVAMLLDWNGRDRNVPIDRLAREAGMGASKNATNANDLRAIAERHGLVIDRAVGLLLVDLEYQIRCGMPFIALVNYADFGLNRQDTNYNSTHWVVVVGFDAQSVYINDADYWSGRRLEGKDHPIPRDVFDYAWSNTLPNGQPRQALIVRV